MITNVITYIYNYEDIVTIIYKNKFERLQNRFIFM